MKQIIFGMALALLVVGGIYFGFYPKTQEPMANNQIRTNNAEQITTNELQITDEKIGAGAEAKTGDIVSVNYVGTLSDGRKFDSSYDHGKPYSFVLGQGQVIQGWDKGILGMKVGGKRKLVIPPELAYGDRGAAGGIIPPNTILIFEVELLDVK